MHRGSPRSGPRAGVRLCALWGGLAVAGAAFAILLFGGLAHPLMWNDEAYTAVYAERVLEYGYPKVHSRGNVVYALAAPLEVGVNEELDAYIGDTWGQYFFAALGVLAAREASDSYAKTALLRLPFAVAGFLGVLLFLLAALPLVGGDRRSRLAFAIGYALLSSVSISLILHLREVRYYALVVFFGGWLALLFRQREISGARSRLRHGVALVLALLGLFASYYPAFVAFGGSFALDAFWRALRPGGDPTSRTRALGLRLAPLALAAPLAMTAAWYLEVPSVVAQLRGDASLADYGRNLMSAGAFLLRFEFLLPVLAVKVLLGWLLWTLPARLRTESVTQRLRLSGFLTLVGVVYWLVIAGMPALFDRYLVVLSPLLTTLLVLDTSLALSLLRVRRSKPALALAMLVAACLLGAVGVRAPELTGRLAELREPVRGPLDVIISYLLERYEDPQKLVIATNYEEPAYVYYLGSQVIVGFNTADRERDAESVPDVIIPRPWQQNQKQLEALLDRTRYEQKTFPVGTAPANNTPSLSHLVARPLVHRFETRLASDPRHQVTLFERIAEETQ